MKRLICLILTALMLLLCFQGCKEKAEETDWTKILERGTINIGICENLLAFKSENGEYDGFNIDLINAVTNDLNLKYHLIPVTEENFADALSEGTVDVIWGAIYQPSYDMQYDLFSPYMYADQVAIFTKDNAQHHPTAISMRSLQTVAVVNGSLAQSASVDNNLKTIGADDIKAAIDMLLNTQAQALVADYAQVHSYLNSEESKLEIGCTVYSYSYCLLYNKDSAANAKIRSQIKKLTENGTLDSMAEPYGLANQLFSNRQQ